MKSFLMALISESSPISMLRVMALASLLSGITMAFLGLYMGKELSGVAQICAVFVTSAFAAKVGQKYAEKKE